MTYQPVTVSDDLTTLPKLPGWVTSGAAETFGSVAFRSGAAFTVLDALASDPTHAVPVKLLANHLALKVATATSTLEGRLARESDIRDAYHLTRSGEARGPDGDLLAYWRGAVRLKLTGRDWQAALGAFIGSDLVGEIDSWLMAATKRVRTHGPLAGSAFVIGKVLKADDRAERVACLLSDVVLARALNWKSILPITSQRLTKAMLRGLVADGQGANLAVQQCILLSIEETTRVARDLAGRAALLHAVAPKLRAKGSEAAVALFLSEDAVAPSAMLSPMIKGTTIPMTDRSARRFCDRLVELGVAHELTDRSTFRLYGITS